MEQGSHFLGVLGMSTDSQISTKAIPTPKPAGSVDSSHMLKHCSINTPQGWGYNLKNKPR